MLTFFYLLLISLYRPIKSVNVGTTLFGEPDLEKVYWDAESITLLRARYFLEALIPGHNSPIDDDFSRDILIYFRIILDSIRVLPEGRKKQLYLYAMRDIIGGYLHGYILPISKFSYYAGILNYRSMKRTISYYNHIKDLLRSEGQGWSEHRRIEWKDFNARKLQLRINGAVCRKITIPCKNIRIYRKLHDSSKEPLCPTMQDFQIPVPFFDCPRKPHAVAFPLVNFPVVDLKSDQFAYAMIKFYIKSLRCLYCSSNPNHRSKSLSIFRDNIYTWLLKEVVPRLNDEDTYVVFGGVLRLIRTLTEQGAIEVNLLKERQTYNQDAGVSDDPFTEHLRKRLNWILNALLFVLALWFMVACLVVCCRLQRKRCLCWLDKKKEKAPTHATCSTSATFMDSFINAPTCEPKPSCRSVKSKGKKVRRRSWGKSGKCDKAYFTLTEESSTKRSSVASDGEIGEKSEGKTGDWSTKSDECREVRAVPKSYTSNWIGNASEQIVHSHSVDVKESATDSKELSPIVELSESSRNSSPVQNANSTANSLSAESDSLTEDKHQNQEPEVHYARKMKLKGNPQDTGCYSDESYTAPVSEESRRVGISSDSIEAVSNSQT